jgi:predicted phospho-2-dehydro-3-deoxyheptonate aldolase
MNGKSKRLQNFSEKSKFLIIPVDHGMTVGLIPGIEKINETVRTLSKGGPTGIIAQKGILKHLDFVPRCGLLLHISANTTYGPYPHYKALVGSVEEALRLGADGVSMHINIGGSPFEPQMLQDLGKIAESCNEWQVPLLVMVYPRGPNIQDAYDGEIIANITRMVAELGADIVKTQYPGNKSAFTNIVEGCPAPVLIAGGPRQGKDLGVLQMVKDAVTAGGAGISLGRNIFQHSRPQAMIRALRSIIFDELEVEEAHNLYLS